jgi:transposase
VEVLRITPTKIEVELRSTVGVASCSICQSTSRRVHSRYVRVVRDLPWGGTPMVLRFQRACFSATTLNAGGASSPKSTFDRIAHS